MKSSAMSSDCTSELYESLIKVQPFLPAFTSRRMATGSSLLMRSHKVSSDSPIPSVRTVEKQVIEFSIEASSIKGIVYCPTLP